MVAAFGMRETETRDVSRASHAFVMAGLDPAIHVHPPVVASGIANGCHPLDFATRIFGPTWIPGSSPGMTMNGCIQRIPQPSPVRGRGLRDDQSFGPILAPSSPSG